MLSSASVADAVAQLYPRSFVTHWEHPDQGMDHRVAIAHLSTGEALVVRWPLTQPYKEHAGVEARILSTLTSTLSAQSSSPATLPSVLALAPTFHIQTYVPGRPIDASLWNRLSASERLRVIDQLGSFLDAVRNTNNEEETRWIVGNEPNTLNPRALPFKVELSYERAHKVLLPLLCPKARDRVEDIFQSVREVVADLSPTQLTLVHSDLYATHLRYNDGLGIIDFSDMNVGDPAIDLQHLAEISPELAAGVCDDADMLQRARTYKQWDNIFLVVDALRRNDHASARELLSATLGG